MKNAIVSLSFDRGLRTQYDDAFPLLEQFKFKGTFYIITEYFRHNNTALMQREHIQDLYSKGHEIGAHSVTLLPPLTLKFWTRHQIRKAKSHLESINIVPTSFAYPSGEYNDAVQKLVKKAGYTNARTIKNEFNTSSIDHFAIKGKEVLFNTPFDTIKSWIDEAKEKNYWLVLIFQHIFKESFEMKVWDYGCTEKTFGKICQVLLEKEIQVETISKASEIYS